MLIITSFPFLLPGSDKLKSGTSFENPKMWNYPILPAVAQEAATEKKHICERLSIRTVWTEPMWVCLSAQWTEPPAAPLSYSELSSCSDLRSVWRIWTLVSWNTNICRHNWILKSRQRFCWGCFASGSTFLHSITKSRACCWFIKSAAGFLLLWQNRSNPAQNQDTSHFSGWRADSAEGNNTSVCSMRDVLLRDGRRMWQVQIQTFVKFQVIKQTEASCTVKIAFCRLSKITEDRLVSVGLRSETELSCEWWETLFIHIIKRISSLTLY